MTNVQPVTILIRNYNGKELLAPLLPGILDIVSKRDCGDEVLLVDDGSTDGSVAYVKKHFSGVRIVAIQPNSGNSITPVNAGVQRAKYEIVFCLDNDVLVVDDFISPILPHFKKPEVFAVCPRIVNPNHGNTVESLNYPQFHRGRWLGIVPGKEAPEYLPRVPTATWYTPGNGSAYRKKYFQLLGGLDQLYRPIYHEDVDICHRAWRRGWQSFYEPAAITYHLKHVTTKKHMNQENRFETIRQKNQLLFTWKNLLDKSLLRRHYFWLFLRIGSAAGRGNADLWNPFRAALRQLKEVRSRRLVEKKQALFSDRAIFDNIRSMQAKSVQP